MQGDSKHNNLKGSPGGLYHGKSHSTLRHAIGFQSDLEARQYLHQHTPCKEMHINDQ